jgi:hypothetical protein
MAKNRYVNVLEHIGTSRYSYERNDCVVVAISIALNISYEKAHEFVGMQLGRKTTKGVFSTGTKLYDIRNDKKLLFGKTLKELSTINPRYTTKQVRYTVGSFSKYNRNGAYIALVSGHCIAIIDGKIYDYPGYMDGGLKRRIRKIFKVD